MVKVANNSPVQLAGIKEGEYIIGCKQFIYRSFNELIETTYDRFFDKEVKDKTINLAAYDIVEDNLRVIPIGLKRGWGGKGLLGC